MKILLALVTILFPLYAFAGSAPQLYAYETSAGMAVGAVFGTLPTLTEDDELISVTSSVCDHVEIHTMKEENGIMKMRRIDSLAFIKNTETTLAPTGYHLMLIGLKSPLQNGQTISVTLNFKKTGAVMMDVPVTTRKAK